VPTAPVRGVYRVDDGSVFLRRNGRRLAKPAHALNTYTAFDPDEYPLAPFRWKAPYPYTAGEVCWSLREILEEGSWPELQTEFNSQ
jgi:hypothetical protein